MTEGTFLNDTSPTSRRKFLAGSAAALAGGALLAVPGVAKAHNPPDPPTDIDILNYALTLEHLEAVFYIQGLAKFGNGTFRRYFNNNRRYRRQGIERLEGEEVRSEFAAIREHEKTHVKTLQSVIRDLGGKPVPESTYNFNETAFTSLGKFLAVARLLENTGVKAYDGAIAHIEAAPLLTAGATIATVEARHASYLNLINGYQPFPSAFDKPAAPRQICNTVDAAFIKRSPEPYGPYRDLDALCNRLPNKPTP
jgi:rubrerythrin